MVRCCYIYKISCIDSTYCNYLNEKQTFVVIPLTSSTALSMSFIAGSLSMFILCYLLKSSFNVAKKPLKCRSLGATHSHTQFKMAVNYSLIGTKIVLAGLNIFFLLPAGRMWLYIMKESWHSVFGKKMEHWRAFRNEREQCNIFSLYSPYLSQIYYMTTRAIGHYCKCVLGGGLPYTCTQKG